MCVGWLCVFGGVFGGGHMGESDELLTLASCLDACLVQGCRCQKLPPGAECVVRVAAQHAPFPPRPLTLCHPFLPLTLLTNTPHPPHSQHPPLSLLSVSSKVAAEAEAARLRADNLALEGSLRKMMEKEV